MKAVFKAPTSRHMNSQLPENYVFMLNLCQQPGCLHPLCGKDVADSTWYDNGPPLTYVPVPILNPRWPWGGDCNECAGFCAGHFLRPEEHKDYVDEFGVGGFMFKPPSVIIKEAFYNLIKNDHFLSDSHLQEVAKLHSTFCGGAEYARGSPAIDGTTAKGRC